MVKKVTGFLRRWLPVGRLVSWFQDLAERWAEPDLPLRSTYDEVIYDATTDTYYGILYPEEMRKGNEGKPVVVHAVGEKPVPPDGAAGAVHELAPVDGAPSSAADCPETPPA